MNPSRRRRPSGTEDAARAYEQFHWGEKPRKIVRAKLSPLPKKPMMSLGRLEAITYATAKRGDGFSNYVHQFEGKKPLLAMDLDNQRLHVVGGSYTVTKRGIEG